MKVFTKFGILVEADLLTIYGVYRFESPFKTQKPIDLLTVAYLFNRH